MGTGQTMMAVGALTLLSSLYITANTAVQENDETLFENGLGLEALRCAQRYVEAGMRMEFDEAAIGAFPANPPDGFTGADSLSLGPDLGETEPALYDDLDDYNGFSGSYIVGDTQFQVDVTVGYVDPDNAGQMAGTIPGEVGAWDTRFAPAPTWVKRMEVRVSSPYLPNDLHMAHVFSYQP